MGVPATSLAAFLAFSCVHIPGYEPRWPKLPPWVRNVLPGRLAHIRGNVVHAMLQVIHIHGLVLLTLDDAGCSLTLLISWSLLKLFESALFHSNQRLLVVYLCPAMLTMAAYCDVIMGVVVLRRRLGALGILARVMVGSVTGLSWFCSVILAGSSLLISYNITHRNYKRQWRHRAAV